MVMDAAAPANEPQGSGQEPTQKFGTGAADELRKTVRRSLGQLFQTFLRELPSALVSSAGNIAGAEERESFKALARAVPANEQRWLDTFIRQVDGHLIGDVKAAQSEAAEAPTTEESFVLANLELRAEELHQNLIAQLDARLERVRQRVYIPIYAKALAPAGLCRALQDTADALQWPASQRRILFEKFDDLVVNELQFLYQSLLDALTRINTVVARSAEAPAPARAPATTPTPTPTPAAAPETAPAVTATPTARPAAPSTPAAATAAPKPQAPPRPMAAPAPRPAAAPAPTAEAPRGPANRESLRALRIPFNPDHLDTHTQSMLKTVACNDSGTAYSDGTLAAELLAIANHSPVPDISEVQAQAPMQRMNLAGHFLSEAIADPLIPQDLKRQHESMRFPLVKSAIADETFFTAVTHPLRSLVNEMMLKSATSRVTGSGETRRIAELLQQVLVQFDLAPNFVREAMLTAKPLGDAQMNFFNQMQRQQAQQRRESVINEAKRIVAHEIEQATFSLLLPEAVTTFLNKGWGPALAMRLLHNGKDHASWTEGVDIMQALVDQIEARDPAQPPSAEWKQLLQKFVEGLTAAGLTTQQIHDYINSLEAARRTPITGL